MRKFLVLLCAFLPWKIKRWLFVRFLGYKLPVDSYIGISIVDCQNVEMSSGSSIRHFNVIRNLEHFEIGQRSSIGNLNWITGLGKHNSNSFVEEFERVSKFVVGNHSSITNRHIIDCTNTVTIGSFTTVAGYMSQILTHGIDIYRNTQASGPVSIGSYCIVGTRCLLLKGANLPDYSQLGAGSVLLKNYEETHTLYAGVPAINVKNVPKDCAYFHRTTGRVS